MASDAVRLVKTLTSQSLKIALAESCTAGLVASTLGEVPGASAVLWGAFVTYTVEAKTAMLGVDAALIAKHGAVSAECARAMAEGALAKSGADIAASVTGLAGPDGDGSANPVGTVWIAVARKAVPARGGTDGNAGAATAERFLFAGTRSEIRTHAAEKVIEKLLDSAAKKT